MKIAAGHSAGATTSLLSVSEAIVRRTVTFCSGVSLASDRPAPRAKMLDLVSKHGAIKQGGANRSSKVGELNGMAAQSEVAFHLALARQEFAPQEAHTS